MVRNSVRVTRFAILAVVLMFLLYKLSSSSVDISGMVSNRTKADLNEVQTEVEETKNTVVEHAKGAANDVKEGAKKAVDSAAKVVAAKGADFNPLTDYERENATFVTLARNSDLWELVGSIRQVEDRFNHQYAYDWVFLNDAEFSDEFKKVTTAMCSGKTHYGKIGEEHWGFPDFIDQERAAKTREEMRQKQVIYGDSIPYRHMCRYESGFFWRHPIMNQFKYYWRVEPSIKLHCDVKYDVFKFMRENKKSYGFTISLFEYGATIETLWKSTKEFMHLNPQLVHPNNLMKFISDDNGETYNKCHFWSNFEVADLDLWRGESYSKYFDFLDHAGGFFYERWGDAPVHSIGAALFADKESVHYFEDIGYFHNPFNNCPTTEQMRLDGRCMCQASDNFSWHSYSCTGKFYDAQGMTRPEGWEKQKN